MITLTGLSAVAVFVMALSALGIVPIAKQVVEIASGALMTMHDPGLNDCDREARVKSASLRLFCCSGQILWRFFSVLALSAAPVVVASALGLVEAAAVINWLLDWKTIVALSISFFALWGLKWQLLNSK